MRHRKRVVVVAILIIAILPLSFLALRIGSRHPAVQRAILSRIMPEVPGSVAIGGLELGLASVALTDVNVDLGERGSIVAPSVTVSVSYRELVARGFDLRRALSTVIVTDPTVVLVLGGDTEKGATSAPDSVILRKLGSFLPGYLGVSGATVVLEDRSSGQSVRLGPLDLLLERGEDGVARCCAGGTCLGSEGALKGDLVWDTAAADVTADLEISSGTITPDAPLPLRLPIDIESGTVSGTLHVEFRSGASPVVALAFELGNGTILLPENLGALGDVEASGRFDGRDLGVSLARASWKGAAITAEGTVDVPGALLRSAEVEARGAPVDSIAAVLGGAPVAVSGRADIDARVTGPLGAPDVSFTVAAQGLRVDGLDLASVRARGSSSPGGLVVDSLSAGVLGGEGLASGSLSFGDQAWGIVLRGEVRGLDAEEAASALGDTGWAGRVSLSGLDVRAGPGSLDVESLVTWDGLRRRSLALGGGAGGFMLRDDTLVATAASSGKELSISGQISGLRSAPVVDAECTLDGFAVDSLLVNPGRAPRVKASGLVHALGPLRDLVLDGEIRLEGSAGSGTVSIAGGVGEDESGRHGRFAVRAPDAVFRGRSVPVSGSIRVEGAHVVVDSLAFGTIGRATFDLDLREPRPIRGSLVVSGADVREVLPIVTGDEPPEQLAGLVFASMSVGGSLGNPLATLQLQVGNASALGVSGLDAALVASLRDSVVDVEELGLSEHGTRVASASGTIGPRGRLALRGSGEGIPGPLLGGDSKTRFDATVGVGGTAQSPTFDATIEARTGSFLGVGFDGLDARITGARGDVAIDRFRLERRGRYTVSASGRVPYSALRQSRSGAEGSFTIEVDGDPLSFLTELVPLADRVDGRGTLRAEIVGARGHVSLASARLSETADRVRPSALLEEMRDVTIDVVVEDGTVVTGTVEGTVGGHSIRLSSVRDAVVDGEPVPPLVAGGVDLGVLALSTDAEGVRGFIPGLMLPDDVGRIALSGKEGAPALLIGGPPERPLLWGEVGLSDVSFTYPLLATSGESPLGAGFLSRSAWSVRMTAGRNLWYWRPDVNLKLERGGFLDFQGVPSDGGLCVSGRVESRRGTITYANTDFDAWQVFVDFPLFCEPPRFYVEATTRVEDGTTITLTMDSYEDAFAVAAPGATLDESALTLASDSPEDDTQEKILSKLQYGVSFDLLASEEQAALERRRALEVVASQISGIVVKPLLSPVEGRLKRALGLDLVRVDVDFVEHFFSELDQWHAQEPTAEYQPFLADTRLTLGKYISRDWLLSYVGVAEAYERDFGDQRLGLRHELGIEYEVSRNTSLSMRVVYDPSLAGWDRRVSIENRYEF
jgi:hypothetical protein